MRKLQLPPRSGDGCGVSIGDLSMKLTRVTRARPLASRNSLPGEVVRCPQADALFCFESVTVSQVKAVHVCI